MTNIIKKGSLLQNKINNKFMAFYIVSLKSVGSFLIGTIFFLLGQWNSFQDFLVKPSIIILIGSFLITLSLLLINNVFDRTLDIFSRKPEMIIYTTFSVKNMLIISLILSLISLILFYFINFHIFIIGFLIISLGFLYSIPPIRIKTHPPFDVITNSLIVGMLPFFLGSSIIEKNLSIKSINIGIIWLLFLMSYIIIFTSLDIKTDRKFGIITFGTKLGLNHSIIIAIILYFISLFLSFFLLGLVLPTTISILGCLPFFLPLYKNNSKYLFFLPMISLYFWAAIILLFFLIVTNSIIIIFIIFFIITYYFFYWLYFKFFVPIYQKNKYSFDSQ